MQTKFPMPNAPRTSLWLKPKDLYLPVLVDLFSVFDSAGNILLFETVSTLIPLLPLWLFLPSLFCVVFLLFIHHEVSVSPLAHSLNPVLLHLSAGEWLRVALGLELAHVWVSNPGSTHHSLTVRKFWYEFPYLLKGTCPEDCCEISWNTTYKAFKTMLAHSKLSLVTGGYHCVFRASTLAHAHTVMALFYFVLSFFFFFCLTFICKFLGGNYCVVKISDP